MTYERRGGRPRVYWYLAIVFALQSATPSLSLPLGTISSGEKSCLIVHANPSSVQLTPRHVVRLLDQRHVQNQFVLELPLKEVAVREEAERAREGNEQVNSDQDTSSVVCRGEWPYTVSPPNALMLYGASYFLDSSTERSGELHHAAFYLLLSSETLSEISLKGNVSLSLSCSKALSYCYNILYNGHPPQASRLLRRSVDNSYMSHDVHQTNSNATPVVAVAVSMLSLVAIVALVALCAGSGSSAYDPQATGPGGAVTLQKSTSEAPSSEVAVQFQPTKAVHVEVKTNAGAPAATNGTVREKSAGTEEQKSSPSHRDSLNPPAAASPQREEGSDRESRSRTLSARSFDPLPAIPKLETAEDNKDKRTKESPPSRGGGDDDDDEAGYAYARVGGAAVGGMDEAESDKDDKTDQASNLPPYGKVSHHVTKPKVSETEEYAEVKEVFRGPAAAVAVSRGRSATDPIEPKEVEVDTVRDKRALTHTHMMPLPAVPKQSVGVDDNEMYDSIPDDVRNSQVPLPQAAAPVSKPRPKERLYESMDEVEDTYESVPDNLRVDSPLSVSSASPSHSPSKLPLPGSSTSPPLPPSSPVPKPQPKEPEKKAVEKTLSASQAEGDGKRRFSFFQRKKTASVSGVTSKKKEKEKEKEKEKHAEKDHKEHHHAHQPLPDVPALSPVMSPPLPPIPANDDEDDTMYDTPQLDFIPGPLRVSPGPPPISPSEAKAKSQSLPSSARGSGAAVFHRNIPLPRVPEDSGQGIVVRQRVLESPLRGGEEEKPYDSIKVSQSVDGEKPYDTVKVLDGLEDINEPNYDTVDKEEILKALAETEDVEKEPGYDRVKQLEEVAGEGDREREKAPTPQPTEGENAAGIRYGKVTRPLSPEEDVPGILPEHDEEGYAVVPEDFKMRKRALSASKGVQPQGKHESPEPVKKPIDELEEAASPDEPAEPSEPYATVDILIKKERRKEGNLTANSDMPRERSVSPVPPPLPPVGDLGEIARDFAQPPIPIQSENVLELLLADGSSSLRPPGSDDPPYAKVKSKDHPYAELDLGGGGEHAKLATQEDNNETEAGYNEVGADVNDHTDSNDKGLVYDTVTDPEVNQEMVDDEAMGYNTVKDLQANQEASSGYDTVIDSDRWRSGAAQSPTNQLANEIPKLELAEPEQQLYDSLEPLEKEGGGGEAGGLYDSLEPEQPQQVENGVSLDMMEEERYEEIDDDRRLELLAKQKQWSQSKSS